MSEIKELEQKIQKYAQQYYEGESSISDEVFDSLTLRLKELDPDNKLLQKTAYGYEPDSHLAKFEHIGHVGSLDKIKKQEVLDGKVFCCSDEEFIESLKLDGASVVCYYEDGELIRVLSRGNGKIGLNITNNILHGNTIPRTIKNKKIISVRGEAIVSLESFDVIGGAHPRNRANGLSQSIYNSEEELKHLKFIAYHIVFKENISKKLKKSEILSILKEEGFFVVNYNHIKKWDDFVNNYMDKTKIDKYHPELKCTLPIDGLVLTKENDPDTSVAFKFEDEYGITKVLDIEWNLSRTGRLVPVLIVEPTELSGATIKRVTSNNATWFSEMRLGVGAEIKITRANEVVPCVTEVIKESDVILPNNCPRCNSVLEMFNKDLVCKNSKCPIVEETIVYNIFNLCTVDSIANSTFDKLVEKYKLNNLDKLRKWLDSVTQEDIDQTFSKITAKKVWTIVKKMKNLKITLYDLFKISNISYVGEHASENLDGMLSLDQFKSTVFLEVVPEYWARIMKSKPGFENLSKNFDQILKLVDFVGIDNINKRKSLRNVGDNIPSEAVEHNRKRVEYAITGPLSKTRELMEKEFNLYGHKLVDVKKAEVLICDKVSNSSKYKTAKSRNITILTEEEFRKVYIPELDVKKAIVNLAMKDKMDYHWVTSDGNDFS